MWIFMAVLSAVFAGITAVFAKCGIQKTDSDVATAMRTIVVFFCSWLMVFLVGSFRSILKITPKSFGFLVLSGLSTGVSWLCYFKALSTGDVNKVAPIDKSSTVLTIVIAIVCFHETNHLMAKLVAIVLLSVGIFLMIERKNTSIKEQTGVRWMAYAVVSAVFASLTSILAKIGITGVESNLGTAIRTSVVLVMAWIVVLAKGKQSQITVVDHREQRFIFLSGITTGASWLCYYYAIQNGIVSVVVPIDKMSILLTCMFSHFFLKEHMQRRSLAGLVLMLLGTLLMTFMG